MSFLLMFGGLILSFFFFFSGRNMAFPCSSLFLFCFVLLLFLCANYWEKSNFHAFHVIGLGLEDFKTS